MCIEPERKKNENILELPRKLNIFISIEKDMSETNLCAKLSTTQNWGQELPILSTELPKMAQTVRYFSP